MGAKLGAGAPMSLGPRMPLGEMQGERSRAEITLLGEEAPVERTAHPAGPPRPIWLGNTDLEITICLRN